MANTPKSSCGSGLDVHFSGLPQQAASQTDAYLLVQGQQLRVHNALLIVKSSVFLISLAQHYQRVRQRRKAERMICA